jgi:hypothetical protein
MWGGTYDYLEIEYWKQRWPFLLVQLYIYIYKRHLACELTWPFTKLNETLNEVKSSAFMSTWELNNPIIHILLSKDSYMAPNHTKSLWKQHYDFWKGSKYFGHVQAMLSGSSLLKENMRSQVFTLENKVLPYSLQM